MNLYLCACSRENEPHQLQHNFVSNAADKEFEPYHAWMLRHLGSSSKCRLQAYVFIFVVSQRVYASTLARLCHPNASRTGNTRYEPYWWNNTKRRAVGIYSFSLNTRRCSVLHLPIVCLITRFTSILPILAFFLSSTRSAKAWRLSTLLRTLCRERERTNKLVRGRNL